MTVRTRIGRWLRGLARWVDPINVQPTGLLETPKRISDGEAAEIAARWRASYLHALGWPRPGASTLQLDLATAMLRIEQAYQSPAMRDFLVHRLYTCDYPRLRSHLNARGLELIAEVPA